MSNMSHSSLSELGPEPNVIALQQITARGCLVEDVIAER